MSLLPCLGIMNMTEKYWSSGMRRNGILRKKYPPKQSEVGKKKVIIVCEPQGDKVEGEQGHGVK